MVATRAREPRHAAMPRIFHCQGASLLPLPALASHQQIACVHVGVERLRAQHARAPHVERSYQHLVRAGGARVQARESVLAFTAWAGGVRSIGKSKARGMLEQPPPRWPPCMVFPPSCNRQSVVHSYPACDIPTFTHRLRVLGGHAGNGVEVSQRHAPQPLQDQHTGRGAGRRGEGHGCAGGGQPAQGAKQPRRR